MVAGRPSSRRALPVGGSRCWAQVGLSPANIRRQNTFLATPHEATQSP
jgi:hypothetical protein